MGNGSLGNVQVQLDGYKKPCYPFDIRPAAVQSSEENPLPECSQCGFVGVYLTPTGQCMDCAGIPSDQQEGLEERQHNADLEAYNAVFPVQEMLTTGHTREALLDRSPANPGHKSHARGPIPVSEALMTKIAQGYSGQSIAEKSSVRKPFTHEDPYGLHPRDRGDGDRL